jgi:hypothetical protein
MPRSTRYADAQLVHLAAPVAHARDEWQAGHTQTERVRLGSSMHRSMRPYRTAFAGVDGVAGTLKPAGVPTGAERWPRGRDRRT